MNPDLLEPLIPLRVPFSISRGTQNEHHALVLRLRRGDVTGYGEAPVSPGVTGETRDQARRALDGLDPRRLDPDDVPASLDAHPDLGPAARAALDGALHDLLGKLDDRPVIDLLELPEGSLATAATVTLTAPEEAGREARAWHRRGFRTLKVKLGQGHDLDLLESVRGAAHEVALWADANEDLTVERALELVQTLPELGVQLLEQPLPRDDREGTARLAAESPVPIVLDEAIQGPDDVASWADVEGNLAFNVKVGKVGGLLAARACIKEAKVQGREVLVGCNIETGLGIAAGAALAGAVDWLDLDGNLFLDHDPFPLPRSHPGHVGTLEGAGLGVHPDRRYIPDGGPVAPASDPST